MSKGAEVDSSMCERPEHQRPRRLADWLNPTGERKVHSLIDKVYKRKNLEMAWERVKANRGAGGVDGQSIDDFAEVREEQLGGLHEELRHDVYRPQPVRQKRIPKAGKPGAHRELGIPTVYDRVCQQALLNRLEPIFEPVFDDASFGYRRGRSQHDALRKVWKELESGCEWVVDGDLSDFFGTVDHDKLLTLVAQRVSDGRVLRLIRSMPKAGSYGDGRLFPTERGTPQGGVASPLLSNILLTPFDKEMRRKGYRLTRYADDWVITCASAAEARTALATATAVLERLGVRINPTKTRIVRVQYGFEFLGYKIKRGKGLRLPLHKIRTRLRPGGLYAYPTQKSLRHFKDQVRSQTSTQGAGDHRGADSAAQPGPAGMGALLQACSRPEALPPARRMGGASRVGASVQEVAVSGMAIPAQRYALRRVGLGEPCRSDSFHRSSSREDVFVKAVCGKTARTV